MNIISTTTWVKLWLISEHSWRITASFWSGALLRCWLWYACADNSHRACFTLYSRTFSFEDTAGLASDAFNHCLEQLCHQGCNSVRHVISELKQGHTVPEIAQLSEDERLLLLEELQNIMAVYDERDSWRVYERSGDFSHQLKLNNSVFWFGT